MNSNSKGFQAVGLTAMVCVLCASAFGQTAARLNGQKNAPLSHGPALRTEKRNYSFRGLQVPPGATSSAIQIPITNGGDVPLTGVSAATHGDFVVTGTSCTGALPAGGSDKSQCSVSVAFRPTASGSRTGDLTVAANGADPMVVALDAGTPITFRSTPVGAASVEWLQLVPPGPLTGSVTGPFAMVLQPYYAYGSIDGVNFAPSSSGTPSEGILWLGVAFQPVAYGTQTGTVTLSDGTTYGLSGTVEDGVQLSPSSVDFIGVPYKTVSGTAPFVLANGSKETLTISGVQATAPFASANHCGATLAAGASCGIDVSYDTSAQGIATGQLTISTSLGTFVASLASNTGPNPALVNIEPVNIFLPFTQIGDASSAQTITITNRDSVNSLNVHGLTGPNMCSATHTSNCYQVTSSTCSTLAPKASCQIQFQYLFGVPSGDATSFIFLSISRGQSEVGAEIYTHVFAPTSDGNSGSVIAIPASLTLPPTAVGQVSDEQFVSLVNSSNQPMYVSSGGFFAVGAPYEFSFDSGCAVIAPGESCLLHVRFMPVGAGDHDDYVGTKGIEIPSGSEGRATVSVHGYGIPTAALASPAYDPLVEPVFPPFSDATGWTTVPDGTYFYGSLPVKNTGSAPLVLANVNIQSSFNFAVDPSQCDQPLDPGAECTLKLTWNPENCPPEGDGSGFCWDSGSLTLESNAASSSDSYSLGGFHFNSTTTSPYLPWFTGPFPVQFGRVQVGSPATVPFSLGINGSLVPAISMSGSGSFQLDNGCASLVGTTTACTVEVTYAPTAPGFDHGSLRLVSTGGISTVTLSGFAIPAQLRVSPSSILFPNTLVYQNPPNQTITMTNTTASPLALGAIYQPNGEFQIAGNTCGTSLAPNATCTITVAFTPNNGVGTQTSSVRFSFGIDDGVETIPITASVTQLTITPVSANFGSLNTGQMAAQTFTVQNIGEPAQRLGTAILQGATITGTNASDFSITANTCAATLDDAQTCSVTVQFKPAASGTRNAVLTIPSSNAGYTSAILTGTGIAPSTGCDQRHFHDHDKDDHGKRDCDCDKDDDRDGRECRTWEHRDDDHEHGEK